MPKIMKVAISILIIVGLTPYGYSVEDGEFSFSCIEYGGIRTATLIGYSGNSPVIHIPSTVKYNDKSYTVNAIVQALFAGSTIETVYIPKSIEYIGNSSFSNCSNLKNLYFEKNGTYDIGVAAFMGCSSLEAVVLPEGVRKIENLAFSGCTKLTTLKLPTTADLGPSPFVDSESITNLAIRAEDLHWIPNRSNLQELTLLEGSEGIPSQICSGCEQLETINLPASLKEIGYQSFYKCSKLNTVEVPCAVTNIAAYAFAKCNNITNLTCLGEHLSAFITKKLMKVTILEGTLELSSSAFDNCVDLKEVYLPEGMKKVGSRAFYGCSSLDEISFPSTLEEVGERAFMDCTSLAVVNANQNLQSLDYGVFSGCVSLKSINLPDSVSFVGGDAFADCSSLECVRLSKSLGSILDSTFWGCVKLTSIKNIPDSISEIGENAFRGCERLEAIALPSSLTTISFGAFWGCQSLTQVYIPQFVSVIGEKAFAGCSNLAQITVASSNASFRSIDGIVYDSELKKLILCPMGYSGVLLIPNSVIEICDYAAWCCTGIEQVNIPQSVERIGMCAFEGCSKIDSVIIPKTVSIISYYAFTYCDQLTSISFLGEPPSVLDSYGYGSDYSYPIGECSGFYLADNKDKWEAAVDDSGIWHGLNMAVSNLLLTLEPENADWQKGSITLKCSDGDTSGVAHTYSLAYYNVKDDVWVLADGDAYKDVTMSSDGFVHLTDTKFSSRNNGIGTVKYRVMDETGRTAECFTRERHALYIALDVYENDWQKDLSHPKIYSPSYLMNVFRRACERYGRVGGYSQPLANENATANAIQSQLNYMATYVTAPGDAVLVYYCGHGANEWLTCYGQNEKLTKTDLFNALDVFPQGVGIVVVIDACHSTSMIENGITEDNRIAWITAALKDEYSSSDYFSAAFCEDGWFNGLADNSTTTGNMDGYVSFLELAKYAQLEMAKDYSRHKQICTFWNDDILKNMVAGRSLTSSKTDRIFRWLTKHTSAFSSTGSNMEVAAATTAANGIHTIADCYELGIDPDNPDDDFKITHFEMVNGEPVFELNHTTDGSGESFMPRIKKLGKADLKDNWTEVPPGGDPTHRFFTVEVETP